ncbi:UTP-glucose-1-phosphate uridylyltransferase, partial [Cladochytrium tenue]
MALSSRASDLALLSQDDLAGASALSAHDRSFSIMGFQETTSSIAAKNLRNHLNKLVDEMPPSDARNHFTQEMDCFYALFTRYLSEKAKGQKLNWSKIKSPKPEQIIPYASIPVASPEQNRENLKKLAVLKLNGGLGTTMGCVGPKSAIEVRDGMTFLDLTVRQIEYLNSTNAVSVPLILMNSFNTDAETTRIIQKYSSHSVQLMTFN